MLTLVLWINGHTVLIYTIYYDPVHTELAALYVSYCNALGSVAATCSAHHHYSS